MNSENQELFVLGTYVTKNNDLTFFFFFNDLTIKPKW